MKHNALMVLILTPGSAAVNKHPETSSGGRSPGRMVAGMHDEASNYKDSLPDIALVD